MSVKVLRVRWCLCCEAPLPKRCEKCIKHPERKPRIVEIFGPPPIIETGPCGCVKLKCQRPGCPLTMWRILKADGTLPLQNHFCGKRCSALVTGAARKTAVEVPCSSRLCKRIVTKHLSDLKHRKDAYCSPKCFYVEKMARAHDAREKKAREEGGELQALACYSERCRGEIRDHKKTPTGLMACTFCNHRRKENIHAKAISAQIPVTV